MYLLILFATIFKIQRFKDTLYQFRTKSVNLDRLPTGNLYPIKACNCYKDPDVTRDIFRRIDHYIYIILPSFNTAWSDRNTYVIV